MLALACLTVSILLASCGSQVGPQGSQGASGAMTGDLWKASIAWIRSGPVEATFTLRKDEYSTVYGDRARLAHVDQPNPVFMPVLGGGPMIRSSLWWANDTDYYRAQEKGPPLHVTPKMAAAMLKPSFLFPFGQSEGALIITLVRVMVDPYRILALSRPQGAPEKQPNGDWNLRGDTTESDLGGEDLVRGGGWQPDALVHTTLEVTPAGIPVTMTVTVAGVTGQTTYRWSEAKAGPKMPVDSVDLDRMLAAQMEEGGARTPSQAAKESPFPLLWLGATYAPLSIQEVARETDGSYTLGYFKPLGGGTTTTSNPAAAIFDGYDLHEYGTAQSPETIERLLGGMSLAESGGNGSTAYTIYAAGDLKQNYGVILREKTAVQVQRIQDNGRFAPSENELVSMAAALTKLEP